MQNNLNLFIAAITDRLYAEGSRKDNPLIPRGLLLQCPWRWPRFSTRCWPAS